MVSRSSGAGSVVGYNYMDDGFIGGQRGWQEIGLNSSHMVGSHHTLFEGNYAFNMDSDATHGNAIYHTFFRNYARGYRSRFEDYVNNNAIADDIENIPGRNGPLRAAGAQAYSYWFSFIGNVLGTPGHTSEWSYDGTFKRGTPGIWLLGWEDLPNQLDDPKVAETAIRDGNFDYVTNKAVWAANDMAHALPELVLSDAEAGLLRCRQGLHLALGGSHRITAALRASREGTLRRGDTIRTALSCWPVSRPHNRIFCKALATMAWRGATSGRF